MTDFWGQRPPDYVVGARVERLAFRDTNPVYGEITSINEGSDASIYVRKDGGEASRLYHYRHWQVLSPPRTNAAAAHLLEGNPSIERKRQAERGLQAGTLRTISSHSAYGRSFLMDVDEGPEPTPATGGLNLTPEQLANLNSMTHQFQRGSRLTMLTRAPTYSMNIERSAPPIDMERIRREIERNTRYGPDSLYGISDDRTD